MLQNPEGPSYTNTVCPKHTPMGEFFNNTAHSNMFYGLRVHPEYYPREDPCAWNTPDYANTYENGRFTQTRAVFNGLTAYKNGMKGAIMTQVGMVRMVNLTLADNGGGERQHVINGKDNGAAAELTWVVDDRSGENTPIDEMAGFEDCLFIAKTQEGQLGTAGLWPSSRKITGVIMHSTAEFHVKHSECGLLLGSVNSLGTQGHADTCTG